MTTATYAPSHIAITPSILYFGTPVALLTTENEDGSANLAPVSSAWALGQTVVLGLGADSQTAANLATRPELVINLPSPGLWGAVERLAPLTGASPVPAAKRARGYRYEPDKFAAAGLTPVPSETVRAPRVAECPLQLEAQVRRRSPDVEGHFLIVECAVARVHADRRIVVPGTQHINPTLWSPLIFNFRHYQGLAPELGHCFTSETPTEP
ncbi:flavin reductase [Streptomyces sp. CB03234]|uniref:flavin reductase family protein n=1 Tax=Streptomyces sp. (strain CB03234) TaxID=1703937 RepID=UPI00093D8454|nr:flavin reductase family protein [Streptomyces sp. CB03234]OKK02564.1 flavin reductase [Streptomyces sp. CB03234]